MLSKLEAILVEQRSREQNFLLASNRVRMQIADRRQGKQSVVPVKSTGHNFVF